MSKYRDRTRKRITLPSGATCFIRKLCPRDFMSIGEAPLTLADPSKRPVRDKPTAEDVSWAGKISVIILTRCISAIEFEGEQLRVVDKEFGTTGKDEISIDELDAADSTAIVSAVQAFSGLGKEAAESAKPFPEKQEASDADTSACEAIRPISLGSLEPVT